MSYNGVSIKRAAGGAGRPVPLTAAAERGGNHEMAIRIGAPKCCSLGAREDVRGRRNTCSGHYVERKHRYCKCGNHNAGVCVHKRANANFNFEIVWSSSPTFSTLADQFQHKIANPAVANNCCAPLAGPEGYFSVSTPAT